MCVYYHTCVGKTQHLFLWLFHTCVVISTRVCENTHLCGKNHTDGDCVVCGFYHTHVVNKNQTCVEIIPSKMEVSTARMSYDFKKSSDCNYDVLKL